MKILDRYIVKHFLIPTIFCTVALIFLVMVADIFDNLEEILRNDITLRQAARYYLSLIPFIFVQVIQWGAFLGILHCLVTFNTHNELTAMKVCGIEITSIIRPLVFVGFLIGIITFLVNDQIVPPTYKIAQRIRDEKIEKRKTKADRTTFSDVTYYGNRNQVYFIRTLDSSQNKITDFIILWLDDYKRPIKKATAREARWNGSDWELFQVNEFEISSTTQMVGQPNSYPTKIYPEVRETPADFYQAAADPLLISYRELKTYLEKLKESGISPTSELVDLQARLASPWNSLIVMLITIPLIARTATRKTIAVNTLACIAVIFSFYVSTSLALAMGKSGKLFPFVSVWFNNFAFGFGAVFFMDRANH